MGPRCSAQQMQPRSREDVSQLLHAAVSVWEAGGSQMSPGGALPVSHGEASGELEMGSEKLTTLRGLEHCSRLPGDTAQGPALQMLKVRLKRALGKLS